MALPQNPNDGQTVNIGGTDYTYDAANNLWEKGAGGAGVPSLHYGQTAPTSPVDGDVWIVAANDIRYRVAGAWENWPMGGSTLPDQPSQGNSAIPVFDSLASRLADVEAKVAAYHSQVRIAINHNTLPNQHGYISFLDVPDVQFGAFLNGSGQDDCMLFIRSNMRISGGIDVHVVQEGEIWWWNVLTSGVMTQGRFQGGDQILEKGVPGGQQTIGYVIQKIQAYGNAAANLTEDKLFGSYRYVYVLNFWPDRFVTGGANGYWATPTKTDDPADTVSFYID